MGTGIWITGIFLGWLIFIVMLLAVLGRARDYDDQFEENNKFGSGHSAGKDQ